MTLWPTERSRNGGVDEIPLPFAPTADRRGARPGRLWLCGKHYIGPDPEVALEQVGATTAVCLTQRFELDDRYPDYVRWLDANAGGRALWFPIPDLHAPPADRAVAMVGDIVARLTEGEQLLMHCGAGIGRAGTTAVAVLMALGSAMDDALHTVAVHRPMAGPEVGSQAALIEELARRWTSGRFDARRSQGPGRVGG